MVQAELEAWIWTFRGMDLRACRAGMDLRACQIGRAMVVQGAAMSLSMTGTMMMTSRRTELRRLMHSLCPCRTRDA